VFFSFHYQRDIFRVEQVKRHYITKGSYTAAGYFNGSLEEEAKKKGDQAVKRLIDEGMRGSSVLCVLIGKETYTRRWVDYEILRAVSQGMGVFGIRIHQQKIPKHFTADYSDGSDAAGSNPFYYLKYIDNGAGKWQPQILWASGWQDAPYQELISANAPPKYFPSAPLSFFLSIKSDDVMLEPLFRVYDWVSDDGYSNFARWLEAAAKQAGK
jgi:hypothetical protein